MRDDYGEGERGPVPIDRDYLFRRDSAFRRRERETIFRVDQESSLVKIESVCYARIIKLPAPFFSFLSLLQTALLVPVSGNFLTWRCSRD